VEPGAVVLLGASEDMLRDLMKIPKHTRNHECSMRAENRTPGIQDENKTISILSMRLRTPVSTSTGSCLSPQHKDDKQPKEENDTKDDFEMLNEE